MKFLRLVCLIAVGASVAAGDAVYSAFNCSGFEKGDYFGTCRLSNVCIGKGGKIKFYRSPEDASANVAPPKPALGYKSNKDLAYELVDDAAFPTEDLQQNENTAALVCHSAPSYSHWLLDNVFSLFWTVRHHGLFPLDFPEFGSEEALRRIDTRKGTRLRGFGRELIDVVHYCQPPVWSEALQMLFTDSPQMNLKEAEGKCYSDVVVGAAGHYLLTGIKTGKETAPVPRKDIDDFRNLVVSVARGTKIDLDEPPNKVVMTLSLRTGETSTVANSMQVVNDLDKHFENVEMSFLDELPFSSQAQMVNASKVAIVPVGDSVANMIFLDDHSEMIIIYPYGYFDPLWKNFAERYGYSLHEFRNENRDRTRFHISILDKYGVHGEARSKIVKADRLDAAKMHWAAQRYWLAQDTVVDTEALVEMIAKIVPRKTGDREEL